MPLRLRTLACALICLFGLAYSSPLNDTQLLNARNDLTVPGPPHFVIYGDRYVQGLTGPPPVNKIKGYNVFALSFLLLEGAWDKAYEWTTLSAKERNDVKTQYHAAGVKLIVSVFGSTDIPTTTGADPIATADMVASWVKTYDLDGVDVDYEDYEAMKHYNGKAEAWLISFTRQLRVHLPQGSYILSHAPVAPWFSKNQEIFKGGAYRTIHKEVGHLIDWYNVQFYNQGEYTTCDSLLWNSGGEWPGTSLFEIAYSGIPWEKLVMGKPADAASATDGFMLTSKLATCIQEARKIGWNGGVMVWQYPDASSSWIQSVRSSSFPM